MRTFYRLLICLVFGGFFGFTAQAQTLETLREEINRAEAEIKATNELLSKTKKDQQTSQSELKLVQNRIRNRQKIVSTLEEQTKVIAHDIDAKTDTIATLETDLERLKREYGEMIYHAYKNYKINNYLVFLFSSKDFNDATRRIAYMKRYNRVRKEKAAQIDSLSRSINQQVAELAEKKEDLDKTYQTRTNELNTLGKDEQQYKTSVANLNKRAGELSSTIKKKQEQINNLQKQIQQIIAEEAKKNQRQPQTAAQQEYIANLSGQFDQNRGKLPYPVRGGVIVDRYGLHEHATQKALMVNNKGVNIAAERGADVRSVFEGEVSRVFFIQGLNNSILIRHGNYFTVYSNLESVAVKAGDKVSLNQVIGKLSNSANDEDHVLHFEIWKETTNLNPESWIRR